MLLSFSVTNFKSIKETQTLSMVGTPLRGPHQARDVNFPGGSNGVLPCALIYGANASGKSNLLDAFVRMQRLVLGSHSEAVGSRKLKFNPFLLDDYSEGEPTIFEISFLRDGVRYDYGFSFNDRGFKEESLYSYPEGRRRKLFERVGDELSFGPGMKGAKRVLAGFLRERSLFLSVATQNEHEELSAVSSFFIDIFSLNEISVASDFINYSFSDGQVDARVIKFLDLIGTGVCDYKVISSDMDEIKRRFIGDFVKLMATYADEDESFIDEKIEDKDYEVHLGHKNSALELSFFSSANESAGTRRLLLMMSAIFRVLDEGDIAVIDEIDASLHTYAVEAIVSLFTSPELNKNGAQIIATTHDTNLLNQEKMRRDEIWFCEKDKGGASEYFSLAEVKSRRGEAFEKAYLQGRYGAMPSRFSERDFLDLREGRS